MADLPASLRDPRTLLPKVAVLAGLVVLGAGLVAAQGLFATLAFGALAAVICRRIQLGLQARGLGRALSLVITSGAFLVVIVALFLALATSLVAMGNAIADNSTSLKQTIADLAAAAGATVGLPTSSVPQVDVPTVVAALRSLIGTLAPAITGLAMASLILVYLLIDAEGLRGRMLRATSEGIMARYDTVANELWVYIKVRAVLGAAAALADTTLLLVLGVPYAVLWGVVSFLFSFVPNLGFIIALIPPTVFAFIGGGLGPALLVIAGYVAINLAFDYVLQPRVMSASLDISPVVVISCILVWTFLVGPMGALLAVPLTIVLRAILVPFPGARWFVAMLGPVPGDPVPEVAPTVVRAPADPTIGA